MIGVLYGPDFFYSLQELGQDKPINTLNVFVGCVENFLETSEKKVSPQKMRLLPEYSSLIVSLIFFKKQKTKVFDFSSHVI